MVNGFANPLLWRACSCQTRGQLPHADGDTYRYELFIDDEDVRPSMRPCSGGEAARSYSYVLVHGAGKLLLCTPLEVGVYCNVLRRTRAGDGVNSCKNLKVLEHQVPISVCWKTTARAQAQFMRERGHDDGARGLDFQSGRQY